MHMLVFTHITGCYVFDEKGVLKDKKEFSAENALNLSHALEQGEWIEAEKKFIEKYPNSLFIGFKKEKIQGCKTTQDPKKILMLSNFIQKLFEKTKEYNTIITKQKVKQSVKNDNLIIQTINHIDELAKITNMLVKRLREWYELYNPEFSKSIYDHEKFIELILSKTKEQLLKELNIKP
ncbi:hypothetical protein KY312_04460, partial [Candidatus Woesearchaeota archaeon]|nr:hypothetical protein [Candidatus Woesearchaeota archaeon]